MWERVQQGLFWGLYANAIPLICAVNGELDGVGDGAVGFGAVYMWGLLSAGAGVAEIGEVFLLDVECGVRGVVVGARDVEDVDGVVVAVGPLGHRCGSGFVGLEQLLGELVELDVFPCDEDERVGVGGLQEGLLEVVDLRKSDLRVHGHAQADCGGLDGGQRPDVGVSWLIVSVIDLNAGIGGIDVVRLAVAANEERGQGERAIEALAVQLAESGWRFLAMADEHDGLPAGRGSLRSAGRVVGA